MFILQLSRRAEDVSPAVAPRVPENLILMILMQRLGPRLNDDMIPSHTVCDNG